MVLLLSEESDTTTNRIIEWLIHYNIKFIRLNKGDNIEFVEIRISNDTTNVKLRYKNSAFDLDEITGYWLWRNNFIYTLRSNLDNADPVYQYLLQECESLRHFLHFIFEKKSRRCISNFNTVRANKLQILNIASECGLCIPATLVSNSLQDIINFIGENGEVIVKPIDEPFHTTIEEESYYYFTSVLSQSDINILENRLFPCITQKNIKKKYEVRTFFFDDKFYSMAIFSQQNPQTKIDFRRYDTVKPNRNCPYQLPIVIEDKLKQLLERLSLKTGSIDIVVSEDNQYYFLEINPVGQFGMVGNPCNYYLEKVVADYLVG